MKYPSYFLCQERAGNQKSITLPSFTEITYKIIYIYYPGNYIGNKNTLTVQIAYAAFVPNSPFWDTFDPKSIRFPKESNYPIDRSSFKHKNQLLHYLPKNINRNKELQLHPG